jgi:hypothetical protein
MRRITAARPSPHPRFLHTLASILEEEEELYVSAFPYLVLRSVPPLIPPDLIPLSVSLKRKETEMPVFDCCPSFPLIDRSMLSRSKFFKLPQK